MTPDLTDMEKLSHLLKHWQDHNEEHVADYRQWADKAEASGRTETAALLREAAEISARVTELFARAKAALD